MTLNARISKTSTTINIYIYINTTEIYYCVGALRCLSLTLLPSQQRDPGDEPQHPGGLGHHGQKAEERQLQLPAAWENVGRTWGL